MEDKDGLAQNLCAQHFKQVCYCTNFQFILLKEGNEKIKARKAISHKQTNK